MKIIKMPHKNQLFKIIPIFVMMVFYIEQIVFARPFDTLYACALRPISTANENDTYTRLCKEKIPEPEIIGHWDKVRARRRGIQAVMSVRYSRRENEETYKRLQEATFDFLNGIVEEKRVFELGVGIGVMTSELAKRAKEVVGIDFSRNMLAIARQNLKGLNNVQLFLGKIYNLDLTQRSFGLVFASQVLLHILNPDELKLTIEEMKRLSNCICVIEHVYQGEGFPSSKYTILRRVEEYEALFNPYRLVKIETHMYHDDKFAFMLFETPRVNLQEQIILSIAQSA